MLRVLDARHFQPEYTSRQTLFFFFFSGSQASAQRLEFTIKQSPNMVGPEWQRQGTHSCLSGQSAVVSAPGKQPVIESTRGGGIERTQPSQRSFDWGQVINTMSLLTCHAPAQRASVQNTEAKHLGLFMRKTFFLPTCQQDKSSRLLQQ